MPRRKNSVASDARDERALERRMKLFRQWIAATREADAFRQILRERSLESRERARARRASLRFAREKAERERQTRERRLREHALLYRNG